MKPNGALVPLGGGDPILLNGDRILIGRHPSCTVCLPCHDVSRRHCELTLEGNSWYITDLGSKNGIRVNGVRLVRKLVAPKDKISIGAHHFLMVYLAPGVPERRPRAEVGEVNWVG